MTATSDGTVKLWSLPDGHALRTFHFALPGGVSDAQISPNGRWLSVQALTHAVTQDTLEIWDVRRAERVKTLRLDNGVSFGRFSPDGRWLAVGDLPGSVTVYSTDTWRPVTSPLAPGNATGASFTPNGRTLATGTISGSVQLWDIPSGQPIGTPLPGVPGALVTPILTADATHVIAGYAAGRAVRWDIRPEALIRHACEVAGRRLTRAEWDAFLPGRPYDPAC